ncbi:MAG: hypothetical protein JSV56_12870 [Methanomassiliicoccales archaeon]|nr:MAG: hypothetical protein JSV56_12870 [Methanomassiliicoccales archaeon]
MNLRVITGLTIIVMLILSSNVIPAGPAGTRAQYGVSMECESNEHYTEVEQFTYYMIKITNTGDSDDSYNLTCDPSPEYWIANLSVSNISIPAGEYKNVMLKVIPTCECEFGARVVYNVTATSRSNASVSAKVTTITTYATVGVTLDTKMDYAQLEGGESYIHEITVTNDGSESDTFLLTASQSPELSTSLDREYITLQRADNDTINLITSAVPSAPYGYYELNVEAESVHNSDKFDILTITVIIGKLEFIAEDIRLSRKNPKEGDPVTISFDLVNTGTVNATDLMITVYRVTKAGEEIEIGSDLTSVGKGDKISVQRDMNYPSNFNGITIEARIKGQYEIWQESFTTEEIEFGEEESDDVPYLLIVLLILVLIVIVVIALRVMKRNAD